MCPHLPVFCKPCVCITEYKNFEGAHLYRQKDLQICTPDTSYTLRYTSERLYSTGCMLRCLYTPNAGLSLSLCFAEGLCFLSPCPHPHVAEIVPVCGKFLQGMQQPAAAASDAPAAAIIAVAAVNWSLHFCCVSLGLCILGPQCIYRHEVDELTQHQAVATVSCPCCCCFCFLLLVLLLLHPPFVLPCDMRPRLPSAGCSRGLKEAAPSFRGPEGGPQGPPWGFRAPWLPRRGV